MTILIVGYGPVDAIDVTVPLTMTEAEARVRVTLAEQGFGVLTEIDVAATLAAKLGVERPPLKILGACNPGFADTALGLDADVALLMPCNVVLSQVDEGTTRIRAIDPAALMQGEGFEDLAATATAKLKAALHAVA